MFEKKSRLRSNVTLQVERGVHISKAFSTISRDFFLFLGKRMQYEIKVRFFQLNHLEISSLICKVFLSFFSHIRLTHLEV